LTAETPEDAATCEAVDRDWERGLPEAHGGRIIP
jgi:hypothetical protein